MFSSIQVYVKNNIFKIPANILLPEDKVRRVNKLSHVQALGQWGRSESSTGCDDDRGLVEKEGASPPLCLPDPART